MKKQFRINNENKIIEVFNYNVFDWIKDKLFLKDCYDIETNEDVQQNMYFIDGIFYKENPNPIPQKLTFEEQQYEINVDLDYRITMLELGM